ncbi:MAG: dienelactone hydrolase family protein [Ardenticatenaceae bacterium]|nr:dienelactone hydrolase family protein [Ardenticatenaceae bacterium]
MSNGPHQGQQVYATGKPLAEAKAAMILVHGRGATAPSILELSSVLHHPHMAYLAPQAQGNTWYPYSFLSPISQNEPGITSGLQAIADLVAQIEAADIPTDKIIIGGFSQGACLASEFVVRHPQRYGGLLVFSGGVIGPLGMERHDTGSLEGMPVFMGCSDVDPHIPVERVEETAQVLTQLGAQVNKKIYPHMAHTIIQDEVDEAMKIVKKVARD